MFVGGSMGSVYGGLLTGLVAQAALLFGVRLIGSVSAK
jgi:acetyl-CoA carboxylase beta subunit